MLLTVMRVRVIVTAWDGASPADGPARSLLEDLGCRREVTDMVWDGLGSQ